VGRVRVLVKLCENATADFDGVEWVRGQIVQVFLLVSALYFEWTSCSDVYSRDITYSSECSSEAKQ